MPVLTSSTLCAAYAGAEALFALFYRVRSRTIQRIGEHPTMDQTERERVFQRAVETHLRFGAEEHLGKWFLGSKSLAESVFTDNMDELISWCLFQKTPAQLTPEQKAEKTRLWAKHVTGSGLTFLPGKNPSVVCMRHTIDPVPTVWRPLAVYLVLQLLKSLGDLAFLASGYRRHKMGGLRYWYRPSSGTTASKQPPILFLHGLGIGLAPYLPLLLKLHRRNRRAQLLIEQPWMSMRLCAKVPSIEEFTTATKLILAVHNVTEVSVVCHSMGSLSIPWLLQKGQIPSLNPTFRPATDVRHLLMIDPVCIHLCLPTICFNFLYKKPRTVVAKLFKGFIAREIGIAYLLHRKLFWYKSNLWDSEHLPEGKKTTVSICDVDRIIPREEIKAFCTDHKDRINLMVFPKMDHSGWMFSRASQRALLATLDALDTPTTSSTPTTNAAVTSQSCPSLTASGLPSAAKAASAAAMSVKAAAVNKICFSAAGGAPDAHQNPDDAVAVSR